MQGISALPGAPQAPGQAAPVGVMPPQQPRTPAAWTAQLEQMDPGKLWQLFSDPLDDTPKWAIASAYAKAVEERRLDDAAKGQAVMQQAQAQAQQPPVVVGVMSQPLTPPEPPPEPPTQFARHGGIMHGYASGGPVQRFANGPGPQGVQQIPGWQDPEFDEEGLPRGRDERARIMAQNEALLAGYRRAEEYKKLIRQKQDIARAQAMPLPEPTLVERMEQFYRPRSSTQAVSGVESLPAFRPSQNYGDAMPAAPAAQAAAPAPRPGPARNSGIAAAAQAAAPASGVAGLMGPEINPYLLMRREAQQQEADILKKIGEPTPEVLEARKSFDALMKEIIGEHRADETQRGERAQARFNEARARAAVPTLEDYQALGEMVAGSRGSKRFGEALSGAVVGGTRAKAAQQEALRRAEERRDAALDDVAKLAGLRRQLQIDQARAIETRASGDVRLRQETALKAAESRRKLAEFEADMADKAEGRSIDRARLALTEREGAAGRANALAIANIQAAARNDPSSKEAAAVARVQSAINNSPLLKQLAESAKMGLPGALEQYRAEEEKLYLRLAPELLVGTTASAGGQGSARPAADAILGKS